MAARNTKRAAAPVEPSAPANKGAAKSDSAALIQGFCKTLGIDRSCFKIADEFTPARFLPTGQKEVDAILGEGAGIPYGTLIEFCGESQSGKSYLSLKVIAEAQRRGDRCAFMNVENSFYEPRAEQVGVNVRDPDKFMLIENIDTAEKYGDLLELMVKSRMFGVIVVDSITALIPQDLYDKGFADNPKMGEHARFVGRLTQKLLNLCSTTETTVILINQFRMGQGSIPGQWVQKSAGGNALTFFTHMRFWINRINGAQGAVIGEDGETVVGGKSRLKVIKTRYSQPNVTTEFPIYFAKEEVNPVGEFLYRAAAKGKEYIRVVRKAYIYADPETGEVLAQSKDPIEFMTALIQAPAPEVRVQGDKSTTAFEFVAGRLRMTASQIADIHEAMNSSDVDVRAPNEAKDIELGEVSSDDMMSDDDAPDD